MESKLPKSWEAHRRKLLDDEMDEALDERINKLNTDALNVMLQQGMELPILPLSQSLQPSEDEKGRFLGQGLQACQAALG